MLCRFCLKLEDIEKCLIFCIIGGLQEDTWKQLQGGKKKGKAASDPMETGEPIKAILKFRRYVFDPKKGIHQSAL